MGSSSRTESCVPWSTVTFFGGGGGAGAGGGVTCAGAGAELLAMVSRDPEPVAEAPSFMPAFSAECDLCDFFSRLVGSGFDSVTGQDSTQRATAAGPTCRLLITLLTPS